MPSFRSVYRVLNVTAFAFVAVACSDKSPVEPEPVSRPQSPPPELIVSDPFRGWQQSGASENSSVSSLLALLTGVEVAYVSLPPGSLPNAVSVTIRNVSAGNTQTRPVAFVDGGFDPIPVAAQAGDELEIRTVLSGWHLTKHFWSTSRRIRQQLSSSSPEIRSTRFNSIFRGMR